jgi:hypothetical protein
MGAARREDFSEAPWTFYEIRKSRFSLGISICIALHRLDYLKFKRSPMWRLSPVGQEDSFSAGAVPTLVLTKNKCDDPVLAIHVPLKLTGEGTGDKIRDAERQVVDMHMRSRLAILILPGCGFEGREMWVRPKPIMMQGRRLMSDQPEGANARSDIALLPLAVSFLPLELNLGFNGDGPGFSRPAAQDIGPPILTIRCCPRLLR